MPDALVVIHTRVGKRRHDGKSVLVHQLAQRRRQLVDPAHALGAAFIKQGVVVAHGRRSAILETNSLFGNPIGFSDICMTSPRTIMNTTTSSVVGLIWTSQ